MSLFFTEFEMLNNFVELDNYVDKLEPVAAQTLPSVKGIQIVLADTSGGGFQLDLPNGADERYITIIINTGGNALNIGGTVNGVAGPHLAPSFPVALRLQYIGNNEYIAATRGTV